MPDFKEITICSQVANNNRLTVGQLLAAVANVRIYDVHGKLLLSRPQEADGWVTSDLPTVGRGHVVYLRQARSRRPAGHCCHTLPTDGTDMFGLQLITQKRAVCGRIVFRSKKKFLAHEQPFELHSQKPANSRTDVLKPKVVLFSIGCPVHTGTLTLHDRLNTFVTAFSISHCLNYRPRASSVACGISPPRIIRCNKCGLISLYLDVGGGGGKAVRGSVRPHGRGVTGLLRPLPSHTTAQLRKSPGRAAIKLPRARGGRNLRLFAACCPARPGHLSATITPRVSHSLTASPACINNQPTPPRHYTDVPEAQSVTSACTLITPPSVRRDRRTCEPGITVGSAAAVDSRGPVGKKIEQGAECKCEDNGSAPGKLAEQWQRPPRFPYTRNWTIVEDVFNTYCKPQVPCINKLAVMKLPVCFWRHSVSEFLLEVLLLPICLKLSAEIFHDFRQFWRKILSLLDGVKKSSTHVSADLKSYTVKSESVIYISGTILLDQWNSLRFHCEEFFDVLDPIGDRGPRYLTQYSEQGSRGNASQIFFRSIKRCRIEIYDPSSQVCQSHPSLRRCSQSQIFLPLVTSLAARFARPSIAKTPNSDPHINSRPGFDAPRVMLTETRAVNRYKILQVNAGTQYNQGGATVAEWLACSPPTKGDQGSIPGRVTGFSQLGIVLEEAVGWRVFSGISRFPRPFIPAPLHTHLNHHQQLSRPR
ncbi:hypothetical protein PR048_014315 [Dryococelus australis]|uniref:Uncharacterized protein n=1 Tax=Dryococelus australis TaxID=614101 RepID=A0ABQ9HE21_9NEOP|nr:hypothetical protein PR048_014315 [Dryococelus australis]